MISQEMKRVILYEEDGTDMNKPPFNFIPNDAYVLERSDLAQIQLLNKVS